MLKNKTSFKANSSNKKLVPYEVNYIDSVPIGNITTRKVCKASLAHPTCTDSIMPTSSNEQHIISMTTCIIPSMLENCMPISQYLNVSSTMMTSPSIQMGEEAALIKILSSKWDS